MTDLLPTPPPIKGPPECNWADIRQQYEVEKSEQFGPRPINIFTRLRKMLELSHEELASRMFTTKLSLIRLEQGCFEKPLESAVKWWLRWSDENDGGLSEGAITHQYEDFQDAMRKRHSRYFDVITTLLVGINSPHPLWQLRAQAYRGTGCSINEVAKSLCLNQATLQHWEKNWRTQKSVPKGFQGVLMATGYSKYEVMAFNEAYAQWRVNNK